MGIELADSRHRRHPVSREVGEERPRHYKTVRRRKQSGMPSVRIPWGSVKRLWAHAKTTEREDGVLALSGYGAK